jgi:hypothetical protein
MGMPGSEPVDYGGGNAAVRSVGVRQPQTAFLAVAGLPHAGYGVVRLIEHGAGKIDEDPARFGQPHATAGAVEERYAQLLFQSPDVLAECRLSDVLTLGGPPKVQLLRYGKEEAKLP